MYLDQGQARQRLGMVRLKYSGGGGGFLLFLLSSALCSGKRVTFRQV